MSSCCRVCVFSVVMKCSVKCCCYVSSQLQKCGRVLITMPADLVPFTANTANYKLNLLDMFFHRLKKSCCSVALPIIFILFSTLAPSSSRLGSPEQNKSFSCARPWWILVNSLHYALSPCCTCFFLRRLLRVRSLPTVNPLHQVKSSRWENSPWW